MSNYSSNDVSLIGHVGNDPFISGEGDSLVATISLATNEKWHDKEGKLQEITDWHKVVYFGQAAKTVQQYVKKRMKLHVKGRLKNNKWKDKEGNEHFESEVHANGIVGFLDKKETNELTSENEA